jgi:hypothetical protein
MNARSRRVLIHRASSGLWTVSVTDLQHDEFGNSKRQLVRLFEVEAGLVVDAATPWLEQFVDAEEYDAAED